MVIVHLPDNQRRVIAADKYETVDQLCQRFCKEYGFSSEKYEFYSLSKNCPLPPNLVASEIKEVKFSARVPSRKISQERISSPRLVQSTSLSTASREPPPRPTAMKRVLIEKTTKRAAPKPPCMGSGSQSIDASFDGSDINVCHTNANEPTPSLDTAISVRETICVGSCEEEYVYQVITKIKKTPESIECLEGGSSDRDNRHNMAIGALVTEEVLTSNNSQDQYWDQSRKSGNIVGGAISNEEEKSLYIDSPGHVGECAQAKGSKEGMNNNPRSSICNEDHESEEYEDSDLDSDPIESEERRASHGQIIITNQFDDVTMGCCGLRYEDKEVCVVKSECSDTVRRSERGSSSCDNDEERWKVTGQQMEKSCAVDRKERESDTGEGEEEESDDDDRVKRGPDSEGREIDLFHDYEDYSEGIEVELEDEDGSQEETKGTGGNQVDPGNEKDDHYVVEPMQVDNAVCDVCLEEEKDGYDSSATDSDSSDLDETDNHASLTEEQMCHRKEECICVRVCSVVTVECRGEGGDVDRGLSLSKEAVVAWTPGRESISDPNGEEARSHGSVCIDEESRRTVVTVPKMKVITKQEDFDPLSRPDYRRPRAKSLFFTPS